jgi:centrosomal protein CEP72
VIANNLISKCNLNNCQISQNEQKFKVIQEENEHLKEIIKRNNKNEMTTRGGKDTVLIHEIDELKKKLYYSQEENNKLRNEFKEKTDKIAVEAMGNQNESMKRDNDIMKIKLKQYDQLQQLTEMLQESHKSLVSTNEHLLQEISAQKQQLRFKNYTTSNNNQEIDNQQSIKTHSNNNNNDDNMNKNFKYSLVN